MWSLNNPGHSEHTRRLSEKWSKNLFFWNLDKLKWNFLGWSCEDWDVSAFLGLSELCASWVQGVVLVHSVEAVFWNHWQSPMKMLLLQFRNPRSPKECSQHKPPEVVWLNGDRNELGGRGPEQEWSHLWTHQSVWKTYWVTSVCQAHCQALEIRRWIRNSLGLQW